MYFVNFHENAQKYSVDPPGNGKNQNDRLFFAPGMLYPPSFTPSSLVTEPLSHF